MFVVFCSPCLLCFYCYPCLLLISCTVDFIFYWCVFSLSGAGPGQVRGRSGACPGHPWGLLCPCCLMCASALLALSVCSRAHHPLGRSGAGPWQVRGGSGAGLGHAYVHWVCPTQHVIFCVIVTSTCCMFGVRVFCIVFASSNLCFLFLVLAFVVVFAY